MKNKLLNTLATVVLGVLVATLYDATKPQDSKPLPHKEISQKEKYSGKTRVIDGDSLMVDGHNTRLLGIDAPEFKQTCLNAKNEEYACGQMSRDFVINFIGKSDVTCYYVEKDRYNRFLGECFIGDVSINEAILKNGMAVIYSFTSVDDRIKNLEKSAKIKKLGIWQGAFQLPKDYRKSHKKKN